MRCNFYYVPLDLLQSALIHYSYSLLPRPIKSFDLEGWRSGVGRKHQLRFLTQKPYCPKANAQNCTNYIFVNKLSGEDWTLPFGNVNLLHRPFNIMSRVVATWRHFNYVDLFAMGAEAVPNRKPRSEWRGWETSFKQALLLRAEGAIRAFFDGYCRGDVASGVRSAAIARRLSGVGRNHLHKFRELRRISY